MLARAERLVSAADYRGTVRRGRHASSELMTVYSVSRSYPVAQSSSTWRFGFIVSKAVGNAVIRNRVRRRLKAICHTLQREHFSGDSHDVVFRAHPKAAGAAFADLQGDAVRLLARATAAPAPRAPELPTVSEAD